MPNRKSPHSEIYDLEQASWRLVEDACDGILEATINGIVLRANRTALKMIGLSLENVAGRPLADFFCLGDRSRLKATLEALRDPEVSDTSEWDLLRSDGSRLRVETSSKLNLQKKVLSIVRDISDRKRTELQPAETALRFESLFEGAPDSILIADRNGRITMVNNQLLKSFGYRRLELVGQQMQVLFSTPDEFKKLPNTFSPSVGALTLWASRKDGSIFPVDITTSSFQTFDGPMIYAILRDVTERHRQQEQTLFISKVAKAINETFDYDRRVQTCANLMVPEVADACIVSMLDSTEMRFSAVAARNGVTRDRLLDVGAHFSEGTSNPFTAQTVLLTGRPLLIEKMDEILKSPDVSEAYRKRVLEIEVDSLIYVPMVVRGHIIGLMTFVTQSPRRRFNRADLEFIEDIANRCAVSLENAKLYKTSVDATRSRELVLSMVSHDLRNPISVIDLAVQLLKDMDSPTQESLNKICDRIHTSVGALERMISDLLDFGKIQSGGLSLERAEVPAKSLIAPAIEPFQSKIQKKNLNLVVNVPIDLPKVNCDASRIVQVLWNLIGNAVKFTPPNGRVDLVAVEEEASVRFSVLDTGPGISPSDLGKLFELFWQTKETANLGFGLGLSIAKGIVQAHDGRIWAESTLGQGSGFHFTVPKSESVDTRVAEPAQKAFELHREQLKGIKILAVDDSEDTLMMLRILLERYGATIYEAGSVADALKRARSILPDIIITDIEMPDGGGYELLKQIRSNTDAKLSSIPIAAASAHSAPSEIEKLLRAGFNFQISKPFSMGTLIKAIQHLTSRRSKSGAAPWLMS